MILEICDVGTIPYKKALELQYELLRRRQNNEISDILLLVEHPPVITRSSRAKNEHIIVSDAVLREAGISVEKTNRGGEVTYHGPGQLVGYIISNILIKGFRIVEFVNAIEEVFITMLRDEYSISAMRNNKNRGVWIGSEKITAIGLAIKKSVSMHGFAFNVKTNLEHFNYIIPCGMSGRGVTSLEKVTGCSFLMKDVKDRVIEYFLRIMGYSGKKFVGLNDIHNMDERQ